MRVVSSGRNTITLASGVAPGERVVTSPLRGAGEGDKVLPTLPLGGGDAQSAEEDEAIAESMDDAAAAMEVAEEIRSRG